MSSPITILGIPGSLRKGSFNRMALTAAQKLVPPGTVLEITELSDIPPFNQDDEANVPEAVTKFKQRIRAADAILFSTAEYNYGIPGVLKNAIDWGTRPQGDNSWSDKPVALMGATPGPFGTSRAQLLMRPLLTFLNMHTVNQPEVLISKAHEKFDTTGNLTDDTTKKLIAKLLENLVSWTERLKTGK